MKLESIFICLLLAPCLVFGANYANVVLYSGAVCNSPVKSTLSYLEGECIGTSIYSCNFQNNILTISDYEDIDCKNWSFNSTFSFNNCQNPNIQTTMSCSQGLPSMSNSYQYLTFESCENTETDPISAQTVSINQCINNGMNTYYYTCNSTSLIYSSYGPDSSSQGDSSTDCNPNSLLSTYSFPLKTPSCHSNGVATMYTCDY
ncbi:hypothetical protein DLAC_10342 [Tieghemostelium lacteum]|uniref:Uncharacterized protein n=1 Tax=Tieghemostelium lacteum TaxID=361077 RepID=A0A151Z572_TIELA|nr:hypothetical protein DLAC_10342 [Tieghemostelium lacteum]|eukprot:KYQ89110.1 hypothetical protein DLAC_10342 [Tieghemostelium lacteum]